MNISDEKILEKLTELERDCGEMMLRAHRIMAETKSGRRDVVTEYDRRIQEIMVGELGAFLPGTRFFCEENDLQESLSAEHVFVIDPIDGTMNFVRGFNHSCISAAYMRGGELTASAVYNPYTGEMFTALKGGGAYLNGRRISVEDAPLSETVVCFGTAPYYQDLTDRMFDMTKKLFRASLDIRREGTAELDLCSVAAGRAGLFTELMLSFWDYAAGMLLVQEAGGICCTSDGGPLPLTGEKSSVAAGSPKAMADYLRIIRE